MSTALEIVLWLSLVLIVWTQLGYPAILALLARVLRPQRSERRAANTAQRSGAHPNTCKAPPYLPRPFARMSAICSSIQSPGSREVTISTSPSARRLRSAGSIARAA